MHNKVKQFRKLRIIYWSKLKPDYVQNYCKLLKTEIELHKYGMKSYKIVTCTRKNYFCVRVRDCTALIVELFT